ncbi:MAG: polysaccharide deacetylase family protein [Caldilineales bacterium]|nr:polysaccharide deacetylase family protein [Caldilineales bacterium]
MALTIASVCVLVVMVFVGASMPVNAAPGIPTTTVTPSQTPVANGIIIPTPSPTPTVEPPAELPPPFVPSGMYSWAKPVTYLDDACAYLKMRWDPANSRPGTIVVPVMYHRIRPRAGMNGIPEAKFQAELAAAHELGYETVTAEQVADFLENNAPIPPRSMMLIVDDRRAGIIERYFMPLLEKYDWTVTSAWIIANSDDIPNLWERMEALNDSGRVDVQSHGLRHTYITGTTPMKRIREELFGPIPIHEAHFGYRPVAFVWPGGNYTRPAVRVAREAGYRIGFTIHPNGPSMFNWIPLGRQERTMNDPLMMLPRYWGGRNLADSFGDAAEMGDESYANALASYELEAAYYHAHCDGDLP